VTITTEIQSAATAPKQGELARLFLSIELAATEAHAYSTSLDVWPLAGSNYNRFVRGDPLSAQVLTSPTKDQIIRSALTVGDLIVSTGGRLARIYECTTTSDPAQSIYRFATMNDQTTGPSSTAPVVKAFLEKPKACDPLEGYERYSKANWDGYDAEPITAETLQYARRLLSIMPEIFGLPDIAPSADGLIGLEWVPQSGPLHKLFFDIGPGPKWRAYWTRRSGEFGRQADASFDPKTKEALQKLFRDLSR